VDYRERGLEYPAWGGHAVVLSHFKRLLREESDRERPNRSCAGAPNPLMQPTNAGCAALLG
jgi:hypothetical protein